jgi:hypothetical protein
MERGEWRVESGGWRVEGGEWRVEGGEWRVESGGWRVEGGETEFVGVAVTLPPRTCMLQIFRLNLKSQISNLIFQISNP